MFCNCSICSIVLAVLAPFVACPAWAVEPFCPSGASPSPAVIFCDDFDGAPPATRSQGGQYWEYDLGESQNFIVVDGSGLNGTRAIRAQWSVGQVGAGALRILFGRVPNDGYRLTNIRPNEDFREVYWRQYLRMDSGWTGGHAYKLSRAFIFASAAHWGQAMIAHLWEGPALIMDPASGVRLNSTTGHYDLVTTTYNDFANLRWLGAVPGVTPIFNDENANKWYCIEAHVKLNTANQSDGIFEYWIDGALEQRRANLNWVGDWTGYGLNAIYFENFHNNGAPVARSRYFDNLVISTARIGCINPSTLPAPTNLRVIIQ